VCTESAIGPARSKPERSKNLNPNLESTIAEFWSSCEGRFVNSYLLSRCISVTGNVAVYSTEYGEDSAPALIKLIHTDNTVDPERQLATWATLSQWSHPHLIRLLDAGQCKLRGVPLLFVVMERAEGSLAEVLPERPLTAAEAREMLEAAVSALTYLHEHGFIYGRIKPSDVVAVGDRVKLSSDCVVRAGAFNADHASSPHDPPELEPGMSSPAGDVWSLGVTLVQALTQRFPDLGFSDNSEVAIPGNLPEPLMKIARNCLRRDPQSRWTISQIASSLRGPQPEMLPVQPEHKSRRIPSPIYAIVAVAVGLLIVILLQLGRRQSGAVAPAKPTTISSSASISQGSESAQSKAPDVRREAQKAVEPPGDWFVVAATYAREQDAAKRALSIGRRWPRFKAEVYSPPLQKQKPYYLVIIGSELSEKTASELRERARAVGLARDAYVTRFPQR
jgi:eukaryotic-like serine/threonine-protein kinase